MRLVGRGSMPVRRRRLALGTLSMPHWLHLTRVHCTRRKRDYDRLPVGTVLLDSQVASRLAHELAGGKQLPSTSPNMTVDDSKAEVALFALLRQAGWASLR